MINIIDLFSGSGGLTEGFRKKPYNIICHIEMDKDASESLRTREVFFNLLKNSQLDIYNDYINNRIDRTTFHSYVPNKLLEKVLTYEISERSIDDIINKVNSLCNGEKVNGIIGGPPCQAFSTIGRKVNESKKESDERIYLYKYYLRFLKTYTPDFFVFENVKGLLSFKDNQNRFLFPQILSDFQVSGYKTSYKVINSSEYGVSQNRERLFIFGLKINNNLNFFSELEEMKEAPLIIKELFSDLTKIKHNESSSSYSGLPSHPTLLNYYRKNSFSLTHHIARKHNENDLEIYRIISTAKKHKKNISYGDLPLINRTHKNMNVFIDRFKCLPNDNLSHTIVAHISKDGHYYIHPDISQNRSITPREAARIQSFPDNFYFEGSRTSIFKQIGNAVPPLLSDKIASVIINLYEKNNE